MATKIVGSGSATAPAITGDDADSGVFFGVNEVYISTNGSTKLTVDSAGTARATAVASLSGMTLNPTTINTNYTIPSGFNAISAGPIEINNATVEISLNSTWAIV